MKNSKKELFDSFSPTRLAFGVLTSIRKELVQVGRGTGSPRTLQMVPQLCDALAPLLFVELSVECSWPVCELFVDCSWQVVFADKKSFVFADKKSVVSADKKSVVSADKKSVVCQDIPMAWTISCLQTQ